MLDCSPYTYDFTIPSCKVKHFYYLKFQATNNDLKRHRVVDRNYRSTNSIPHDLTKLSNTNYPINLIQFYIRTSNSPSLEYPQTQKVKRIPHRPTNSQTTNSSIQKNHATKCADVPENSPKREQDPWNESLRGGGVSGLVPELYSRIQL